MTAVIMGLFWGVCFVGLESVQAVYFGGVFQRLSSLLVGGLTLGVILTATLLWSAWRAPDQLRLARRHWRLLLQANIATAVTFTAFLMSVQLIEPAIAYTISSGIVPLAAIVAALAFGGVGVRNAPERLGNLLVFVGVIVLIAATLLGQSGFVRGGVWGGFAGIGFAVLDGVLFTWMLIASRQLSNAGMSAFSLFGMRSGVYVVLALIAAALGVDSKGPAPLTEVAWAVWVGLLIIAPPLYALQRAVALLSTMTLGAITVAAPLLIFAMQRIEGRVEYSDATLIGLALYMLGGAFALIGGVDADAKAESREST